MAQNGAVEKELTSAQARAIAALLTGHDAALVSKSAGVSLRTLARWRRDPLFAAALREARLGVMESATAKLRGAASAAVATLTALLDSDRPSVRARAAESILSHAYKAAEIEDLAGRLDALERKVNGDTLSAD